jgi:hypothetical protein
MWKIWEKSEWNIDQIWNAAILQTDIQHLPTLKEKNNIDQILS